jgi:hypothetical protein
MIIVASKNRTLIGNKSGGNKSTEWGAWNAFQDQGCQIFLGTINQQGGGNTKLPQNILNCRKIDQMSIKYTNILHCKAHQNLPKFRFLVSK